jgi:hypothetical protein
MVQYALVDDETGELNEFARLQVPEHFDFQASALLGTNLVAVLGLNGNPQPTKRGPGRPPGSKNKPVEEEVVAEPPPPSRPAAGRQPDEPRPFISREHILDVVNQHPEGITSAEIAAIIVRQLKSTDESGWAVKAVSNRFTAWEAGARANLEPLPYRYENVPFVKTDGTASTTMVRKYIYPLDGAT